MFENENFRCKEFQILSTRLKHESSPFIYSNKNNQYDTFLIRKCFIFMFKYEKDDTEVPSAMVKSDNSVAFVNITSRHTPVQSVIVAPMELNSLQQASTADPVRIRLEKNGFTTLSTSRPASATNVKQSSVRVKNYSFILRFDRLDLYRTIKIRNV